MEPGTVIPAVTVENFLILGELDKVLRRLWAN